MSDAPVPSIPPQRPASTLRRDILSAYAASIARIASWIFISALLFRSSPIEFAMFALIRGTIGLLNYTALGMSPAVLHMIVQECARRRAEFDARTAPSGPAVRVENEQVLSYASAPRVFDAALPAYSNGIVVALVLGLIAIALVVAYGFGFEYIHQTGSLAVNTLHLTVVCMGAGIVLRLVSDVPAAVAHAAGRINRDCWLIVAAEGVWVGAFLVVRLALPLESALEPAAAAFLISSIYLAGARSWAGYLLLGRRADLGLVNRQTIWTLISFGSLITIAQLADFLYAPTDYILINHLLGAEVVAIYAPAVQIDAALLLVVSAIAMVLFPRAAMASAEGNSQLLRRYYIRGTLGSAALLLVASILTWLVSPWLLKLWLGDSMPATRAILPLVLIHSVIGGSSAVGRSILLGMGRVKPFTISVLVAGVTNVLLSYGFVRYLDLGLMGIVLGTIIAVTGRCAIWMPWYVLRQLGRPAPI
jgi:O-antigen/teichoic acid export membrane protein